MKKKREATINTKTTRTARCCFGGESSVFAVKSISNKRTLLAKKNSTRRLPDEVQIDWRCANGGAFSMSDFFETGIHF